MFAIALLLTEPKRLTVVPLSWFSSFDIVQIFNYGISHTKSHRIFYSPNPDDDPVFNLTISTIFGDSRANHMAKVLSVWATSEDANNHMYSRRHLLPAIYNANLEKFHFTSDSAPAEIKQEGLIWLNETNVLELSDSEDENGAGQVDQEPFAVEYQNRVTDFISEPESDNENGTEQSQNEDLKLDIVFPNAPNSIIDLTPDNDVIRDIIAFSGEDFQSELQKEMDCCFWWDGDFPAPSAFAKEENDPEMHNENDGEIEIHENKLDVELGIDAAPVQNIDGVLGKLMFEVKDDGDRMIAFEGATMKMPLKLHALLLNYNKHRLYSSDYFDSKFVLISVSSNIRSSELRNGGSIQADDVRLNFARELFRHRVQNDEKRMQWYVGHILKVNEWLKSKCME